MSLYNAQDGTVLKGHNLKKIIVKTQRMYRRSMESVSKYVPIVDITTV